eukprot:g3851.t1
MDGSLLCRWCPEGQKLCGSIAIRAASARTIPFLERWSNERFLFTQVLLRIGFSKSGPPLAPPFAAQEAVAANLANLAEGGSSTQDGRPLSQEAEMWEYTAAVGLEGIFLLQKCAEAVLNLIWLL